MTVIRSSQIVFPDGIRSATIHVREGVIAEIGGYDDVPAAGVRVHDFGPLAVLPGLVDTHVHINEPGRTEWEGFVTATRAAAAGGVTTIVDMPLNSIPATTNTAAFDVKLDAAVGKCFVDVGFWGGVVPGNRLEIARLADAGVYGFKCFLSPSGVPEFAPVSVSHLHEAMEILGHLRLPLLVHAELPDRLLDPLTPTADGVADPRLYATWLQSRPPAAERAAIDVLIRLAKQYGTHVHIVHLACADALPVIDAARRAGVAITVETCPHYLTFTAEHIGPGQTAYKCAPPIREAHHRDALWGALVDGGIDLIASDHSPAPAALKHLDDGDFVQAWGGIASLQLGLQAVWTGAVGRGLSLAHVARWMSEAPARLAGLDARKGAIAIGRDADFLVFDPDAKQTVNAAALYHRHPVTPYDGRQLRGSVHTTMLRGEIIYSDGRAADAPSGRLLNKRWVMR